MSQQTEHFFLEGWIAYLANLSTLLVNIGLIATGVYAWGHRKEVLNFLRSVVQWLRRIYGQLKELNAALQRPRPAATTRSDASEGEPAKEQEPSPAAAAAEPAPVQPEQEQASGDKSAGATEGVPQAPSFRKGCAYFIGTATALLAIGLLARYCAPPASEFPSAVTPTPQPEDREQEPSQQSSSTQYLVPRLIPETSCRELAVRCSPERSEASFNALLELNNLTPECEIRYGSTIEMPANWQCPDPLRGE